VHIWGGLGSQLYAWALLVSLQEKFPRRKITAVFHNGGVTLREPELEPYLHEFDKAVVQDYRNGLEGNYLTRYRNYLKEIGFGLLRIPFRLLGFIASADNDDEFSKVKPWVVSLRGHYSNRRISRSVASRIENTFFREPISRNGQYSLEGIAVHFRLGDLLHLGNKEPLKIENLALGIQKANAFMSKRGSAISICSDSLDTAKSSLEKQFPNEDFVRVHLAPRETINFLRGVSCFVGTPSKISEWVTIFRVNSGNSLVNFLPRQMYHQMGKILEETSLIYYY
jgi:hypothetical protein